MKKYCVYLVTFLALSALLMAGLASCDLFPVSIEQRISMFEDDLNTSGRGDIYLHFHPQETAMYDQIKNPAFFEGSPLDYDNEPFTITISSGPTSIGGGQEQLTGTFSHQYDSFSLLLIMMQANDSDDWLIKEFDLDGGTFEIKRE
ncbi:MAG: hypothetical protein JW881_08370 [Spirochaetales bacterium]|nr:hypothetical protein [Spirochaetales bacterium]